MQHASRSLFSLLVSWETNVELRKHVTRRKRHLLDIRWIPRTQNNPSIIRFILELIDDFSELVDALACVVFRMSLVFCAEMPPLETVDGAEFAFFVVRETDAVEVGAAAVSIPNLYAGVGEGFAVGTAGDEPEKFAYYGAEEDAFCGEEGEDWSGWLRWVAGWARKGELHLWGERHGEGARPCSVGAVLAILNYVADQGEVLVFFVGGVAGWHGGSGQWGGLDGGLFGGFYSRFGGYYRFEGGGRHSRGLFGELEYGLEGRSLKSKFTSRARWEGTKGAVNRDCASGSCGVPYRMPLT